MNNLSPIAWVFICFIVLFTISINMWLFSARKQSENKAKKANVYNRIIRGMQDPFAKEDAALKELSEATEILKTTLPQTNKDGVNNEK